MLVPSATGVTTSIGILLDVEDILIWTGAWHFKPFWHGHVYGLGLGLCLVVCLDKVNLARVPLLLQGFGNDEANGGPGCNRGISLIIVNSLDLLGSIQVEAGLPLVDFTCCDAALPLH